MNLVQISLHIMINWTALVLSQTIYFNFHIANFLTPCVFWELRRQCKNWKKTIIFQKSHPFPYFYSNESKRNRETTQCLLSSGVSRTNKTFATKMQHFGQNWDYLASFVIFVLKRDSWKIKSQNNIDCFKRFHSSSYSLAFCVLLILKRGFRRPSFKGQISTWYYIKRCISNNHYNVSYCHNLSNSNLNFSMAGTTTRTYLTLKALIAIIFCLIGLQYLSLLQVSEKQRRPGKFAYYFQFHEIFVTYKNKWN